MKVKTLGGVEYEVPEPFDEMLTMEPDESRWREREALVRVVVLLSERLDEQQDSIERLGQEASGRAQEQARLYARVEAAEAKIDEIDQAFDAGKGR